MQDFKIKIEEAIKKHDFNKIRNINWHEWELADLADLLLNLNKTDRAVLFRLMPRDIAADVFSYLDKENKNSLLKALTDEETRLLLANLKPDDRTDLFEELPGQVTQRLLNLLSVEELKEVRFLLGYPEKSVGRLMTSEYVAVRPEWKVKEALEHIRKMGGNIETLNIIYITDENWKLLDALELEKFILADPEDKVADIMNRSFVSLSAFDNQEKAVQVMQKYDVSALPVTDSDGILIGVVTFDDVLDVAQEEATEDFHKGAAVAPLKNIYREAGIRELYFKRVGWLVVLVFVMLIASEVIAFYEELLASFIALAFFIPLLNCSGGNAGSQSATLTVRALATGDLKTGQLLSVLRREIFVAFSLGVVMAFIVAIFGMITGGAKIALIVGITMIVVIIAASLIGVLLPFFLARISLDPAVASNPLITSIVDILSLFIYFFIANWFLHIM
ncbi:magnesium transporter [Thermosyntropha lipolytica DSM 11003]|uniref:Magnesium transporter MgtE n=1 Tax=Thermosyntropha lipolytica DSM 11003 TaxID=1123382 RepID=A0A1M5JEX3_9FIRM|nr:magnesium transporter [Thermosyntropha lipolytica]SHG38819.1 magnesium transporter [Thermosyntropha lipolytica DSM 11003]